jgi:hypothetical protein
MLTNSRVKTGLIEFSSKQEFSGVVCASHKFNRVSKHLLVGYILCTFDPPMVI